MKKRFLTVACILASSLVTLSGKPYEKPVKETYFRKAFAIEGETFLYSYSKAYGSKTGDCMLRLEDKIQIEDRGCDEIPERIYYNHMKAVRIGDDKDSEIYLRKAFLALSKFRTRLSVDKLKADWEKKKPKTLLEELPSYLGFIEGKTIEPKFWMYGYQLDSTFGLSTEGDEKRLIFKKTTVMDKKCKLYPLSVPESPALELIDYDCNGTVEWLRDSVDVKVYSSIPKDLQKAIDTFYTEYLKRLKLKEVESKWGDFKEKNLDKLKMLDPYTK